MASDACHALNQLGQSLWLDNITRDLLDSDRFQRLVNLGARPQRLLFASTGTKDKSAFDTLYICGLAAPNTMPEDTLLAFADHGVAPTALARDGGDSEAVIAAHAKAGIDLATLSARLQADGAKGFVTSWNDLLAAIDAKSKVLA